MMHNTLEIYDRVTELTTLIDRVKLMSIDIEEDFIVPLDLCNKSDALNLRMLVENRSHAAAVRMNIVGDTLHILTEQINELATMIAATLKAEQEAAADAPGADEAEEEARRLMVDEDMNTITTLVSVIEQRPDFIHRMHELKKAAILLASGHSDIITEGKPR